MRCGASDRSPRRSCAPAASSGWSTCGRPIPIVLRDTVGSLADWLRQLANGVDDRPVVPNREAKSSGSENTYPEDLTDLATIRAEIADMAVRAVGWLTRKALLARTVTIKVRYADFTTITRSHTALPTATNAPSLRAGDTIAGADRGRPPAGPVARRQRAQLLR